MPHETPMTLFTVDQLVIEASLSMKEFAERAGLELKRATAIYWGRWTPSPKEREKIAKGLKVKVSEVSWGHTMTPRNVRNHQFGMKEDF